MQVAIFLFSAFLVRVVLPAVVLMAVSAWLKEKTSYA